MKILLNASKRTEFRLKSESILINNPLRSIPTTLKEMLTLREGIVLEVSHLALMSWREGMKEGVKEGKN